MTSIFKIQNELFQFITDAYPYGDVVSELGRVFSSREEAFSFLYGRQESSFSSGHYLDLTKYNIVEFYMSPMNRTQGINHIEHSLMNNEFDDKTEKKVRAIATQIVHDGFSCVTSQFLNFLLTDDKYQLIMSEIVPPHMLYSVDEFMNVGILGCDLDVLGSISLTATTEQLRIHDIEGVLRRRSDKISK